MPTIYPGETRIIERNLFQADGVTALLVSSLLSASAELRQGDTVITTLVKGTNAEIRQGTTTSKLEVELTSAITSLLSPGTLSIRWKLSVANSEFTVQPSQAFIDYTDEQIFDVSS